MRRSPFLFAVVFELVLAGVGVAVAARFTDHMDELAAAVPTRDGELPQPLDKASKKIHKAFGKVEKEFARSTTSEGAEIKSALKVGKALLKVLPGDDQFTGLLQEAAGGYHEDLASEAEALRASIEGASASGKRDRALAILDDVESMLDAIGGSDPLTALAALKKVDARLKGPRRFKHNGGGGGSCTGRALKAGESFSGTEEGLPLPAVTVEANATSATDFGVSWHWCSAGRDDFLGLSVVGTPALNTPLDVTPGPSLLSIVRGAFLAPGFESFDGTGTITFTEANATTGTYAGNFSITANGKSIAAEFRITGVK